MVEIGHCESGGAAPDLKFSWHYFLTSKRICGKFQGVWTRFELERLDRGRNTVLGAGKGVLPGRSIFFRKWGLSASPAMLSENLRDRRRNGIADD